MEEHIQDATSHQHLDDVKVNVDRRNLDVMQELLEERRERKVEPCVELLIAKKDGTLSCFLSGRWISIH